MILRLGHVEVFTTDLDDARELYVETLGFVEAAATADRLYLRGVEDFDTWTLCVTANGRSGVGQFAVLVSELDVLAELEALHERLGCETRRVSAGEEPGQGEALRVRTPDGHALEFYRDMEQVELYDAAGGVRLPMRATHRQNGVPPLRIDHVNLRVTDVDAALRYWGGELGFSTSELVEREGRTFAAWTRRSPFTHDVALVEGAEAGMHHVGFLVGDAAAQTRAADLLGDAGRQDAIEFGPGRHGLTNAHFLYLRDGAGNRLELFEGDYVRDTDLPPIKWSWEDYDQRGRLAWDKGFPARFMETSPVNPRWPGEQVGDSDDGARAAAPTAAS